VAWIEINETSFIDVFSGALPLAATLLGIFIYSIHNFMFALAPVQKIQLPSLAIILTLSSVITRFIWFSLSVL
jgi:hypothetical protein